MTFSKLLETAYSRCESEEDKNAVFYILIELLNINYGDYLLKRHEVVDKKILKKYFKNLNKYFKKNMPVQYIYNNAYFYNKKFYVNKNVLIPRAESEFLVEKVLKYGSDFFGMSKKIKVLDLATGSGCLGISIALNSNWDVTLSDVSKAALRVARKNMKIHNVNLKITKSNWLNNIKDKFDLIISNPPYVEESQILDEKVKKEPLKAIYSGKFGISSFEEILKNISKNLCDKYLIAFEHGQNQNDLIANLIKKNLNDIKIVQEKDLAGKSRYTFIFKGLKI